MDGRERIVTLDIQKINEFLHKKKSITSDIDTRATTTRLDVEDLKHLEIIKSIIGVKTNSEALRWGFRKGWEALEKEGSGKEVSGLRRKSKKAA